MPSEAIKKHFLPVLAALAQDPVPNIRMNVAKTISKVIPHSKGNFELEVRAFASLTSFLEGILMNL